MGNERAGENVQAQEDPGPLRVFPNLSKVRLVRAHPSESIKVGAGTNRSSPHLLCSGMYCRL